MKGNIGVDEEDVDRLDNLVRIGDKLVDDQLLHEFHDILLTVVDI